MQHIQGMAGGTVESGFAAPAQFIETDRGERSDQGKTCRNRECQWQERIVQGQVDQQNSEQGINHAQKNGVAGHCGKIVNAAGQCITEIGQRDAANDQLRGICARADKDVRKGH